MLVRLVLVLVTLLLIALVFNWTVGRLFWALPHIGVGFVAGFITAAVLFSRLGD